MVSQERLDTIFSALSDPTRRAILQRIGPGEMSVTDVAAPFSMSLPAVSKHLSVLERAGLLRREKVGRSQRCRVVPGALDEASNWISGYERFWRDQFASLTAYLQSTEGPPT